MHLLILNWKNNNVIICRLNLKKKKEEKQLIKATNAQGSWGGKKIALILKLGLTKIKKGLYLEKIKRKNEGLFGYTEIVP